MDYKESFSKRLVNLREKRGITQQELADKLEITRQSLSLYEKTERTINIELLAKIADFFNVSTDYLMGRTEVASMNEDIKTACRITGLSEDAINKIAKILNDHEKYEYIITINDIIGDYRFPELFYYINKYAKCLITDSPHALTLNADPKDAERAKPLFQKETTMLLDKFDYTICSYGSYSSITFNKVKNIIRDIINRKNEKIIKNNPNYRERIFETDYYPGSFVSIEKEDTDNAHNNPSEE